jgi:DNA-binding response OmpR family regulator
VNQANKSWFMGSKSILIVEDDAVVAIELALTIEALGYEVVGPSGSYAQARLLARRTRPDIAFIDRNLLDGPTGLALAHELNSLYGTAVIMATANPEGIVEGEGDVVAVVRKPYTHAAITAVLERVSSRDQGQAWVDGHSSSQNT